MGEDGLASAPWPRRRQSLRLKGYDYGQPGGYFVTICTYMRECLLGHAVDGEIMLSGYGRLIEGLWRALPWRFPGVKLDALVVMPNHIHVLVVSARRGEAFGTQRGSCVQAPSPNASPLQLPVAPVAPGTQSGSLVAVVQNLKSISARKINQVRGTPGGPVWQRNYYEHVVRNEAELDRLRRYIVENPVKWEEDENNPGRQRLDAVVVPGRVHHTNFAAEDRGTGMRRG